MDQHMEASQDFPYLKLCEPRFRHIYSKLEKWEYEGASDFQQDMKSVCTFRGIDLSRSQREVFNDRFETLWGGRELWGVENGDG